MHTWFLHLSTTLPSLREKTHLKEVVKALKHLKKHPKKEHVIIPTPFVANFPPNTVVPYFNHQNDYFSETLDLRFLDPLFKQLDTTVLEDSNHGRVTAIEKSITSFFSFAVNMPVEWGALRKDSIQTVVRGAEVNTLKLE